MMGASKSSSGFGAAREPTKRPPGAGGLSYGNTTPAGYAESVVVVVWTRGCIVTRTISRARRLARGECRALFALVGELHPVARRSPEADGSQSMVVARGVATEMSVGSPRRASAFMDPNEISLVREVSSAIASEFQRDSPMRRRFEANIRLVAMRRCPFALGSQRNSTPIERCGRIFDAPRLLPTDRVGIPTFDGTASSEGTVWRAIESHQGRTMRLRTRWRDLAASHFFMIAGLGP